MQNKISPSLTFLSLALVSVSVNAVDNGKTAYDLTQLPFEQLLEMDVETASKFAHKISDAPTAVSIVTAEDIKAYGYRTLADILSSMRGLYITKNRIQDTLGGRGFGRPGDYSGRIMLLIDGVESNDNISGHILLGNDAILDTELIERVEYAPGTGSTVHGNGAYFGVINIITKKSSAVNGLQIAADAASYDSKKGRITYGKRLENGMDLLLSASAYNSRGQDLYFSEFDAPATNNGIAKNLDYERNQRLFAKGHIENWTVEGGYVSRNKGVPTAPYNNIPAYSTSFNAPYAQNDDNAFLDFKYDTDLGKQLKLSADLYYGQFHNDALSDRLGPYSEALNGNWWGLNSKFVGNWFDQHQLVFGAEYRNDYRIQFDIQNIHKKYNTDTSSIYLQDEIAMLPDLKINLGARYDYSNLLGGNSSPRTALIYQASDQTTLKTSWSTAYHQPTASEMFYEDGVYAASNTNLRTEYVKTSEFVLEHFFQKNTRFTAVLYQYTTDNLIANQYNSALLASQFQNVGSGKTSGAEFEFENIWENSVRLRSSVSWQKAIDYDGEWMVNSPQNLLKINLTFPFLRNKLRSSLEALYTGPRRTFYNTTEAGHTVINMTLTSARLFDNVDISFGIRNLLDRKYGDVTSWYNQQTIIPQNGRNYWLQLSSQFK